MPDVWRGILAGVPSVPAGGVAGRSDARARGLGRSCKACSQLTRLLGGSTALAWTLHFTLAGHSASCCAHCGAAGFHSISRLPRWRRRALLVTPYLFLYDLVVLAVPMAFLIRAGCANRVISRRNARNGFRQPSCSDLPAGDCSRRWRQSFWLACWWSDACGMFLHTPWGHLAMGSRLPCWRTALEAFSGSGHRFSAENATTKGFQSR